MFRPMRRFKQQIADSECKEILKNEKRGVLSLLGDDGYPYGLPLSHFYSGGNHLRVELCEQFIIAAVLNAFCRRNIAT